MSSEFVVLDVREVPCLFPSDHPLGDTLFLWHRWAAGRAGPTWRDVELYEMPPKVLRQTLVVDVIEGGKDYMYRFWGTEYTARYGTDETGKRLSEIAGTGFIDETAKQLGRVMDTGTPHCWEVTIRSPYSGAQLPKLNLRMPVMDEPGVVTKIISASLFGERQT